MVGIVSVSKVMEDGKVLSHEASVEMGGKGVDGVVVGLCGGVEMGVDVAIGV